MQLGTRVACIAKYVRRQRNREDRYGTDKYWHVEPIARRIGFLVGLRTISNGIRIWEGSEEGYSYSPTERFPAALVVFSLHENPVLVPYGALEEIHGED